MVFLKIVGCDPFVGVSGSAGFAGFRFRRARCFPLLSGFGDSIPWTGSSGISVSGTLAAGPWKVPARLAAGAANRFNPLGWLDIMLR